MKLALGTASWGQPYGLQQKTASLHDIFAILDAAKQNGIDLIDTAPAYGVMYEHFRDFRIITKTPWDGRYRYGVLVHNPDDLTPLKELFIAKQNGKVQRVGVSVYTPAQLERALQYPIDIVQIPLNIFDGRFLPYLPLLRDRGIEIHARSVFLQGLLLMDNPPFAREQVKQIRAMGDPIDVCLGYVLAQDVDAVVVGVNSAAELQRLVKVKPKHRETRLQVEPWVIDPRTWEEG